MSELDALFASLKTGREPPPDGALTIELHFRQPRTDADLFSQIRRRLSAAQVCLKEVFAEAGKPDRFFFLTLPEASPRGLETYAFDLARRLGASLGAEEANLLLSEGLTYGNELDSDGMQALASQVFRSAPSAHAMGWAPDLIEADEARKITQGADIKIAQIDTGHTNHVELDEVYTYDLQLNLIETGSPADASDRFSRDVWFPHPGHGAYGASVMASRGGLSGSRTSPPGLITGVAPEAKIIPIRAIRSVIDLNQKRIPKAIQHAIAADCDVITMCLGGISHSLSVQSAMKEAVDAGLIIVCAAGNVWPWVVFPAAYAADRKCVAVAAIDEALRPWEWTARGAAVTVSAPGENVWAARKNTATGPNDCVDRCEGTTLACSLTAGVAALFVAKHGRDNLRHIAKTKNITVQELFMRAIVHNLTPPPVWGGATNLGAGVVNALSALDFDPGTARQAPFMLNDEMRAPEFVTAPDILRRITGARSHLAALEVDAAVEPYAQEMIWRSYVRGARGMVGRLAGRAGAEKLTTRVSREDMPTPGLVQILATRPNLAAAIGF